MRDTTTTVILVRSSTARVGGAVAACLLQAWTGAGPAPEEVIPLIFGAAKAASLSLRLPTS